MDTKTKKALEDFAYEVTNAIESLEHLLGISTVDDVKTSKKHLLEALDKDNTITETR